MNGNSEIFGLMDLMVLPDTYSFVAINFTWAKVLLFKYIMILLMSLFVGVDLDVIQGHVKVHRKVFNLSFVIWFLMTF